MMNYGVVERGENFDVIRIKGFFSKVFATTSEKGTAVRIANAMNALDGVHLIPSEPEELREALEKLRRPGLSLVSGGK